MKKYKGIFLHTDMSGLCNKLRGYTAARTISKILNIRFTWRDTPNWACPERLDNFYDVECAGRDPIFKKSVLVFNRHSTPHAREPSSKFFSLVEDRISWQEFCTIYRQTAQELTLRPALQSKLSQIKIENNLLTNTIAVHVRRTDKLRHDWVPYVSDEVVFHNLDKLLELRPTVRFFLACDNCETRELYLSRYENMFALNYKFDANYETGKHELDRRLSSIEDAVLDLHTCSLCEGVIGITNSSFSKFAAVLGDISYFEITSTTSLCKESLVGPPLPC